MMDGMQSAPPSTPSESRLSKAPAVEKYEFFKVIQGYLDQAAKLVDLQPHVQAILAQPKNEIIRQLSGADGQR